MIEVLFVALAAVAVLAYVLVPLRSGPRQDVPLTSVHVEDAEEKKRSALTALIDIEEERDIGKLSEGDFNSLRTEYEAEAFQALVELDALEAAPGADGELEDEISALRAKMTCSSCGALRPPGEACEHCGAPA